MTDVFLSYKREDKRYAHALAEALARRGLDVWWDVDLLPGERFAEEIEQVIERAKVAVTLWSERSIRSDYVIDESRLAKDRGILVPARIDGAAPPLGFRSLQTEDLSTWDARRDSPVIQGLVDAVACRAGKTPAPNASERETAGHLHARDEEAKLWGSICNSHAPSAAEYRLYLDRYPQGLFAELARLRIESLKRSQRPGPMKLVAGATALVVLVGSVFGLITQWPEVTEVVVPAPTDAPASNEGADAEAGPATPTDTAADGDDAAGRPARDAGQPADLSDLATFTDTVADGSPCDFCPEMVVIPAGTFTMGSPPDEEGRQEDEGPRREVSVRPFAIGRFEVTFAQYDACVNAGGCAEHLDDLGWGRKNMPVINVSWSEAQSYAEWLSDVTGEPYQLPSEAQWEYGARAGSIYAFSFGSSLSPDDANFAYEVGRPATVGSYYPNRWGVFDMHGNVWEWTQDCWHDTYEAAPATDQAWLNEDNGDCSLRVLRGGAAFMTSAMLRSANRLARHASDASNVFGFRVARTLTP
jgi:formylglycine-generating enzyme required for sulfatase activity